MARNVLAEEEGYESAVAAADRPKKSKKKPLKNRGELAKLKMKPPPREGGENLRGDLSFLQGGAPSMMPDEPSGAPGADTNPGGLDALRFGSSSLSATPAGQSIWHSLPPGLMDAIQNPLLPRVDPRIPASTGEENQRNENATMFGSALGMGAGALGSIGSKMTAPRNRQLPMRAPMQPEIMMPSQPPTAMTQRPPIVNVQPTAGMLPSQAGARLRQRPPISGSSGSMIGARDLPPTQPMGSGTPVLGEPLPSSMPMGPPSLASEGGSGSIGLSAFDDLASMMSTNQGGSSSYANPALAGYATPSSMPSLLRNQPVQGLGAPGSMRPPISQTSPYSGAGDFSALPTFGGATAPEVSQAGIATRLTPGAAGPQMPQPSPQQMQYELATDFNNLGDDKLRDYILALLGFAGVESIGAGLSVLADSGSGASQAQAMQPPPPPRAIPRPVAAPRMTGATLDPEAVLDAY